MTYILIAVSVIAIVGWVMCLAYWRLLKRWESLYYRHCTRCEKEIRLLKEELN